MLTFKEARQLLENHLAANEILEAHFKPILLENEIIERTYGWFFQFSSRSWLEYKKPMAPGSCSHILILRESGRLVELGSAYSIASQIERFDKRYRK